MGRYAICDEYERPPVEPEFGSEELALPERAGPGSIVEDRGRLIRIEEGGATRFRGVLTPMSGRLI
jgi:hypothetical protein